MTVSARFLHSVPRQKIATLIRDRLARCREARIVSGFATPDGVDALRVGTAAPKVTRLVLGAGTFKAFQALDTLIAAGLPASAARLHLGFTRATGWPKNPFERLRPMLHSKIYYFEMPDGTAAAFVGSHNLTGFALRGMNGEASVLLEGPANEAAFADIRAHIEAAYQESANYDTNLKEAYARWYADWLDRLKTSIGDGQPRPDGGRTLLVVAQCGAGHAPAVGHALYFEIDKRIERVSAIDAEVHVLLFDRLPASPRAALAARGTARHAFRGKVQAIDARSGAAEINTDWFVDRAFALLRAPRPFRPTLSAGKQQVTVEIEHTLME